MESITLGSLAVWNHSVPNPKARVLIIHGLSEHSGRHLNTVRGLNESGIDVVRFDLRGSGKSGGKRQWIESFGDYVDDAVTVFNWIQRDLSALPLFVYGHSLGGAIAINFASTYHSLFKGLILSAPAYLVGAGISPLKITVGKMLVKIAPNVRLPKSTASEGVSRDKKVVEAYQKDPLCFHFNTLKQGDEILKNLPLIPELAHKITIPTLIAHGSADPIIRVEGSYEILKALSSPSKELYIAPGSFHELHNELEEDRKTYFRHLDMWISNQLKQK
jgi:alpha-beta hydrolase superfamily lysophospholipase